MENNWKAWIPHHNLENKYFICKMVDDEDGLQLFLISNDYTKKICVQFPGMVYAYRNRLELAALRTLDKIEDKTRGFSASDWTFFVVENSAYAKEIAKESQDIYLFSQLIHFAIVGGQALFEVITDALPIIAKGREFSPKDMVDEMTLPRGITGFWSVNTAPPPLLDEKAFCQMCYTIAHGNGGTVAEVDTDTSPRNFYSAQIRKHDDSIFILQNIHYPYAAFAGQDDSGGFVLTHPPEWLQLPEGQVNFLSLAELNQDWHGLCQELGPEELEQIRYWKPKTVGEIIFNTWD